MIVEIRKREDPGDEVVWQTNKKGEKKRFRFCRCFRRWFQVIKFTMPYIFVRSSMNQNGLFSNQTFIDFENVATENGQALGTILSAYLGSQLVITNPMGTGLLQNPSQFTHGQNQSQTHCVSDRPPHLVLNKLEYLGYRVVAANSQRPGTTSSLSVAYNVWTLHKPLAWTTTDIRLHTASTCRERTSWSLTFSLCLNIN